MGCKQIQASLSAYLDDELPGSSMATISAHLLHCPACSQKLQELSQLQQNIGRNATYHVAPASLKAKISSHLTPQHVSTKKRHSLTKWPWVWINLSLASISTTAFAAVLMLYLTMPSQQDVFTDEILASHFRSLTPGRLIDVVSSDQHTVKPWYAGKLDFSPPVQDLKEQNFALLGGRIDYVLGRNVAALAYQHNKHIINLFVWPQSKHDQENHFNESSLRGYQILQWSSVGMQYVAVSDLNAAELRQFCVAVNANNGINQTGGKK